MGDTILTALFFADDLVLITEGKKNRMNQLLSTVQKYCKNTKMTLAVGKTYVLTNGDMDQEWEAGGEESLKEVIEAKYLGIDIKVRGRNPTKTKEQKMINQAQAKAYTILNLTREGINRAKIARTLWETCVVPAVLYATDIMIMKEGVIKELDKIQRVIGRFITQVPKSTATAAVEVEAGLIPFRFRIMERRLNFYRRIMMKSPKELVFKVLKSMTTEDTWLEKVMEDIKKVGGRDALKNKKMVKEAVRQLAKEEISTEIKGKRSLESLPLPAYWFKLQPHVTDEKWSKWICRTRVGNSGLGNRGKNKN